MIESLTYSAEPVLTLLQEATGRVPPPRLLRATQAVAFGVFLRGGSARSSLIAHIGHEGLRRLIQSDNWRHVHPAEADAFVDVMCRTGIIAISRSRSAGTVDVCLSGHALLRRRPPAVDTGELMQANQGALLGCLFELLDARGAYVVVTEAKIGERSGMSRSAVKRGITRLERHGLIIRQVTPNQLRLAWSPRVLRNSWQGVKRFELKLAADGRSISVDSRLRVCLPGGGVTFLPPGCRIEVPEQTVAEFQIEAPDGRHMAPPATSE